MFLAGAGGMQGPSSSALAGNTGEDHIRSQVPPPHCSTFKTQYANTYLCKPNYSIPETGHVVSWNINNLILHRYLQLFFFKTNVYDYSSQDTYDVSGSSVISLDLFTEAGDVITVTDSQELFEFSLPLDVSVIFPIF